MVSTFERRAPHVGAQPGTLVIAEDAHPTQLSLIHYTASDIEEHQLSDAAAVRPFLERDGVTWVDIQGLSEEATLRELAKIFNLHPLALEDAVNFPQMPKVEHYDDHLLLVTRAARLSGPLELEVEQVTILLGEGYVVTFQQRRGAILEPVRRHLRSGKKAHRAFGADYLAYTIFDTIVDGYFPLLEQIGDILEELEAQIMTSADKELLHTLARAKKLLLGMRRVIWPQRDAASTMISDDTPFVGNDVQLFLRDTHRHCLQAVELTETYRELVGDMVAAYMTAISNRTNDIMKVLTIITSIFIPLSFLTGVYGMNFDNMPELHNRWSYFVLLAVMALLATGLFAYFYLRGWLGGGGAERKGAEKKGRT